MALRTFVLGFTACAGLGFAALNAQDMPAAPAQPEVILSMDDLQIASILQEIEIPFEVKPETDGTNTFIMDFAGTNINLYQYRDEDRLTNWKLSAGYDIAGRVDANTINLFNEKNRFGYAYVDREGDPFVSYDMDMRGGTTRSAVKYSLENFGNLVKKFEQDVLRR